MGGKKLCPRRLVIHFDDSRDCAVEVRATGCLWLFMTARNRPRTNSAAPDLALVRVRMHIRLETPLVTLRQVKLLGAAPGL